MAMWIKGSRNLLDKLWFASNVGAYWGSPIEKTRVGLDRLIEVKPSTEYALSIPSDFHLRIAIQQYDENKNRVADTGWKTANITLSTTANTKYIWVCVSSPDYSYDITPEEVQQYDITLHKGDTALPYEPYRPPQRVKAVFKSKNLLPYPHVNQSGTYNGVTITINNDGTINFNGECTEDYWFVLIYFYEGYNLEAGTYTISGNTCADIVLYFTDRNTATNYYNYTKPATFTLTQRTPVYATIKIYKGYTYNNVVIKPMINKGNTALPYEPYFPFTKFKAIPKSRNLLHLPYNGGGLKYNVIFTGNDDGTITVQGETQAGEYANYYLAAELNFENGKTYAYGTSPTLEGVYISILIKDENGQNKYLYSPFTWSDSYTLRYIYLNVNPNKTVDTVIKPMLNEGSTLLPYEPPQEIWK